MRLVVISLLLGVSSVCSRWDEILYGGFVIIWNGWLGNWIEVVFVCIMVMLGNCLWRILICCGCNFMVIICVFVCIRCVVSVFLLVLMLNMSLLDCIVVVLIICVVYLLWSWC